MAAPEIKIKDLEALYGDLEDPDRTAVSFHVRTDYVKVTNDTVSCAADAADKKQRHHLQYEGRRGDRNSEYPGPRFQFESQADPDV